MCLSKSDVLEPENHENWDFAEPCYPLKVVLVFGISLGMLSTSMKPNSSGLTSVMLSHLWFLGGVNFGDFSKIDQNPPFSAFSEHSSKFDAFY